MISRRQIIESQQQAGAPADNAPGGAGNGRRSVSNDPRGSRQYLRESRASSRADIKSQTSRQTNGYKRAERLAATPQTSKSFQDYQLIGQEMFGRDDEGLDSEQEPEAELEACLSAGGRNQLHMDRHFDPYSIYGEEDEEEDVWYSEERLFEDHIQEIVDKWLAIDDEIWAKIICMERNRRIAKAYARKHSLTVNGSQDEYLDGTTLGLNSFDNPDRDLKTRHIKQFIGQGLRIKITHNGDILVKRMSKANVFVHCPNQEQAAGDSSAHTGSGQPNSNSSSSDAYALNSDSGADLYGETGTGAAGFASSNSFSNYHLAEAASVSASKSNSSAGKPPASSAKFMLTSDASTSSSSGNGKSIGTSASGKTNPKQQNLLKASGDKQAEYTSIALEFSKPVKIFDMSKFKSNLEREARSACPNRKRLQNECISIISFVVDDNKILNLPSWIMVINIVAIDLLKSELGLMDPQDLLLFDELAQPALSERNLQEESQIVHSSNYQRYRKQTYTNNNNNNIRRAGSRPSSMSRINNNDESIVSSTHPMMMMMQRKEPPASYSNVFVAASKKAFANAAASGAYNREPEERGRKLPVAKASLKHNKSNGAHNRKFVGSSGKNADIQPEKPDSDGELQAKRNKLITSAGGKLLKQVAGNNAANKHQSSSNSSSGFNSNCSNNSQNDSSPASSSSNIAGDLQEAGAKPTSGDNSASSSDEQLCAKMDENQLESSFNLPASSPEVKSSKMAKKANSRGARPPKLPHRMVSSSQENFDPRPLVSSPIPIPAPPASQGKANLILVSPTGLSPPLPKRNQRNQARKLPAGALDDPEAPPTEFQTIRHIDESGNCSVLLDNAAGRRPVGIPAHAQLAPPATQRHILRYLMSATRNKFAAVNMDQQQYSQRRLNLHHHPSTPNLHAAAQVPSSANMFRYRRPLPVVPGELNRYKASQRLDNHDENLYYCGLQARATSRQPPACGLQAHPNRPPLPPKQPLASSNSAIEAILADYRQSQFNQLLMNQQQQQQRFKQNQQQPSLSVTKPLMKFFGGKSTNKQAAIFSSVDNLNMKQESRTANILGLKLLKRSSKKAKETSS